MSTAKDKLVAEGLYDRETCDLLSDAEAETLWRLHQEIGQAADAVRDAYTATLGLENSQLSHKQRADIVDKAEALMENCDRADTDAQYPRELATQLTACLRRHHDLGLKISKIRDGLITRRLITRRP